MAKDEARHGRGFEGLLKRYFNTELADGQPNGNGTDATSTIYTITAEQLLNYNVDFGTKHSLAAFAGNSIQYTGLRSQSISASGFSDNELKEFSSASVSTGTTSSSTYSLVSWFGGVNYSLLNRYALMATFAQTLPHASVRTTAGVYSPRSVCRGHSLRKSS